MFFSPVVEVGYFPVESSCARKNPVDSTPRMFYLISSLHNILQLRNQNKFVGSVYLMTLLQPSSVKLLLNGLFLCDIEHKES